MRHAKTSRTSSAKNTTRTPWRYIKTMACDRRIWLPLLILTLIGQTVAIGVLYVHASMLSITLYNKQFWPAFGPEEHMNSLGSLPFKMHIQSSNQSNYYAFIGNIQDARQYAPEARISLPLNIETRKLVYSVYFDDYENPSPANAVIHINSTHNLSSLINIQSIRQIGCANVLSAITFSEAIQPSYQGLQFAYSQALADGRTMYVYQLKSHECSPLYDPEEADAITELLKQVQSY